MKQIGSNAAILTAIVGVLIIANMVADRFGASAGTISVLVLMLAVLSVAFAALSTATMKVSVFSAAGRRQPALHVGLLVAGIAGGLSGLGSARTAASALPLVMAIAAGLVIAAGVAGAIRRTGASSFAQMMDARFRSRAVTLIAAVLTVGPLSILAMIAGDRAVGLMGEALHLTRTTTALVSALLVLLILLPGGALGLISVGLIFGAMALVAWGVPLVPALALPDGIAPEALARTIVDFSDIGAHLGLTLGYAFGAAGVFVLLGVSATAATARTATGAHLLAALLVIAAGAAAIMTHAAVGLTTDRLQLVAPAALPPILYSERARGLVTICGIVANQPEEAQRACVRTAPPSGGPTRMLAVSDRRDGLWPALVLGLPLVIGVVHGLALPLLLLFAFASVVRALAQVLVQDVLYWLGDFSGTASGRLALVRMAIAGLVAVGLAGIRLPPGGYGWVQAALFIAAAVPVPMLLLAGRRRADWRAALCALLAAAGVSVAIAFQWLPNGLGLLAAVCASVLTGWLASMVFASADPRDADAADVFAGRAPGPLCLDRSA